MIVDNGLPAVANFLDLDLETDRELQEVIELMADVCKTPIALITLLDEHRQYIKLRKGVDAHIVLRPLSFCTHTLQQDDVLVVPDVLLDERFVNNPMVTGEPGVRFYAGAALINSNGHKIGTICVIDTVPHQLTDQQQLILRILAKQVMKVMELKLGEKILKRNQKEVEIQREFIDDASIRLRSFFESSTNFHVLLGKNGEIIDFNKTAFNFVKAAHGVDMKRGDQLETYIAPSFVETYLDRYYLALKGHISNEVGSTDYGKLGIIWWEATFEPARDKYNDIVGISYIIRNVTDRQIREQKIIEQNQSLVNIAHIQAHEFRGPLTTIMGLMNLIKEEDYTAQPLHFHFMEKAIYMLDDKIRKIIGQIDSNVIGGVEGKEE
ncbi:GAF domain-containing protein [Mucilaginibacter flavus]|uniref:GAF domain-containing protein n=1 Tax=Mucilaginibacter flavus TaxID=931504 RepID=UPI0025B5CF56|nr:GAF domain-containing protein [Mucilaginibacter flavus]MDN3579943.1 GAF domain-containing protein [Mucilaginibacter flavus]